MPRYQDVRSMGAVVGMVVPEDVACYAYRRGLFVLAQSGDLMIQNTDIPVSSGSSNSVVILNDDAFEPTAW